MKMIRLSIFSMACIIAAASAFEVSAQEAGDLRFGQDGVFKIVQFTDTHLDASSPYRIGQGNKTFSRLSRVLREEKPDFVAFTGDVVSGTPASVMWKRLADTMNVHKIPFCVVLGNHDAEQDLTRRQIASEAMLSPYSLNRKNTSGELADMEIPVLSSAGDRPALVLYFMDSHDYSRLPGTDGYDWFPPEQVGWMRDCCSAMTEANGGKPLPALAFFHIALPEYRDAWRNPENTSIGRAAENECPGVLNTGMYAAMVEGGSVMGMFVGHDHDIDYLVAQHGLVLGYGRFSGDDTTYNNLRPGARVIILEEGVRGFRSYITEDDGRKVDNMVFDGEKIIQIHE